MNITTNSTLPAFGGEFENKSAVVASAIGLYVAF
jgi:hypothetical protein